MVFCGCLLFSSIYFAIRCTGVKLTLFPAILLTFYRGGAVVVMADITAAILKHLFQSEYTSFGTFDLDAVRDTVPTLDLYCFHNQLCKY